MSLWSKVCVVCVCVEKVRDKQCVKHCLWCRHTILLKTAVLLHDSAVHTCCGVHTCTHQRVCLLVDLTSASAAVLFSAGEQRVCSMGWWAAASSCRARWRGQGESSHAQQAVRGDFKHTTAVDGTLADPYLYVQCTAG